MKSEKPTYEELEKRIRELEHINGLNRRLEPSDQFFQKPEFSKFINLSRDGKIIGNKDGKIVGWNKAMVSISGIRQEEALGSFIWDIKYQLTPDEEKYPQLIENLKAGILNAFKNPENSPDQIHQFTLKASTGDLRTIEDHSTFIESPDGLYFLSILRDITDKKTAELTIKDSEERHRGLLNSLDLGILVYSKTGEIVLANPKACELFEVSKLPNENLYKLNEGLELLTENYQLIGEENCPVLKIFKSKEGIKNSLLGARSKGSSTIKWLIINGLPEYNSKGEIDEIVISLLDVTDRRKNVEALHIKNVALDSSVLPIGITNLNGQLDYVNPALVKQWGYIMSEEMIGKSAIEFWENPEEVRKTINKAYQIGSSSDEHCAVKKNGQRFPVNCKISVILDENKHALGLVGSFEDLTEIKHTQEVLKESEEKFKSIANYSASWEGWFNKEGKLVWMNPYSIQLTGYSPEEYIAAEDFFSFCIVPEDLDKVKKALTSALRGSSGKNLEVKCNKKGGGHIWISVSWQPIYDNDGNSIGIRTSSKDITDRIETSRALQRSKSQFDNLAANIDVGVYIIHSKDDGSFRFDYVSPRMADLLNAQVDDILQNPMVAFQPIHPEEWDDFIKQNRETQVNYSILDWQGRIIVNDEIRWIHIVSKPEVQVDGDVLWNGLIIDITHEKIVQEEIALKNTQLLKVISEKDKFFSIIAHDLRNPFNAFLGLTKIMVEDISHLSREEIHEIAEAMSTSANNLHGLLENLLEWSRLQRGITDFNPKRIFAKTQLEESIKANLEQAERKNISVKVNVSSDLNLNADIDMFSSAVRNLFSNAIKFTNFGGTIEIEAKADDKKGVIISVKDSGIGMKPEILNKLFKIDEHVNRPGTDGEPSTGLGLILCKDFVEKHGGDIWAESVENEGSTFYFSIPVQA